jgi:RimJ/RimL family protein N-acetyltransferase
LVANLLNDDRAVLYLPSLQQKDGWTLELCQRRFEQRKSAQLQSEYSFFSTIPLPLLQPVTVAIIEKARNFDLYLSSSQEFVGIAGYRQLERLESCNMGELGLIISSSHHRQGLGFEICRTLLEEGFAKLQLDKVFLITEQANASMCLLSKKLGMEEDVSITLPATMAAPVGFSILRGKWGCTM